MKIQVIRYTENPLTTIGEEVIKWMLKLGVG